MPDRIDLTQTARDVVAACAELPPGEVPGVVVGAVLAAGWVSPDVAAALRARVTELEAQLDRITDLFEAWATEENEHRLAGEHGLAEGLHVAIEMLRLAVHGTHAPSYPPGDEPTHPRTAGGGR